MYMWGFLQVIEKIFIGDVRLQPFYESLHRVSVRGMNYMQSQEITKTGEIFAMTYAKSKVHEGKVILFDVGANRGQFTRQIIKVFQRNFQLYSFEPSSNAFNDLTRNDWGPGNDVKLYQMGLGKQSGTLTLYRPGSLFGTAYPLSDDDQADQEIIQVNTLDQFCLENQVYEIFYLKIDVEGGEYDVLTGARDMVKNRRVKFIQFEYGPNSMQARVFLKDFFQMLSGYQIYRIVKNGLRPIQTYNEILEIPLTSNFLAELKYDLVEK